MPQKCPQCASPITEDNRFCPQCGTPLEAGPVSPLREVPDWEREIPANFRALMPPTLAEKIRRAAENLSGERREVTVLVVHVETAAGAGGVRDQEEAYLLARECVQLLVDVIYKFEGHVDRVSTDGVMALFGAPIMHENEAERAVRAAWEMRRRLMESQVSTGRSTTAGCHLRLGIHTGSLIIGKVDLDREMEYTVIGDTVQQARQLASAAGRDQIVVSRESYRRTQALFAYRPATRAVNRTEADPPSGYLLDGVRLHSLPLRGLNSPPGPMVGRGEALEALRTTLDDTVSGREMRAVIISGEAGIGKSRLVAELCRHVSAGDETALVLQAACTALGRPHPYGLMASLLGDLIDTDLKEPAAIQRQRLAELLGELSLDAESILPFIAHLMGSEFEGAELRERRKRYDADVLGNAINDALHSLIAAIARRQPTLLVLEDLHWLDEASWQFLRHLLKNPPQVPLLLLLVSRADDAGQIDAMEALIARYAPPVAHLSLTPLSGQETRRLVEQLLPDVSDDGFVETVNEKVAGRADGNPYFAEELIRMLLDRGGILREEDRWRLSPAFAKLIDDVPGTLQGLILARSDRLETALRTTLQKASVLGNSFPEAMLGQVCGLSPGEAAAHLEELIAQRFLMPLPNERWPTVGFCHSLVQEAIYGTLLRRRRQHLHALVASVIEESWQGDDAERIDLLAHHFARSHMREKALPYIVTAIRNAADRFANETVVHHFTDLQALYLQFDRRPDAIYQRAALDLGVAQKLLGRHAEALATFEEIVEAVDDPGTGDLFVIRTVAQRELADTLQREGQFSEAEKTLLEGLSTLERRAGAAEQNVLLRLLLERLSFVYLRLGKLEAAAESAQRAMRAVDAAADDNPVTTANLLNTLGGVNWQTGDHDAAIRYVQRGLELYQLIGYRRGVADAYSNLGILQVQAGRWGQTEEMWERALALRQEMGDTRGQVTSLTNLGELHVMMGKYEAANDNLDGALDLAQRLRDSWLIAMTRVNQAHLFLLQENWERASQLALTGAEIAAELEARTVQIQGAWLRAHALLAMGRQEQARVIVGEAMQMAEDDGFAEGRIDCLRVLGLVEARAGNFTRAESALNESDEVARQVGDSFRRGRALAALGRLYESHRQRQASGGEAWREQAIAALRLAVAQFDVVGATRESESAAKMLDDLRRDERRPAGPELAASTGQRHNAAILWLTVERPSGLDDEDAFETYALLSSALATIAREADAYVRRSSQGLLAVFGAPVAHEDDPERAARAAWRMRHYARSNHPEWASALRAVITYGQLLTGAVNRREQGELLLEGAPIDEARALLGRIPAGQLVATDAVRAQAEHLFAFRQLSAAATSASLWEITAPLDRPTSERGFSGIRTRFVGRDTPLWALSHLADNLERGIGGIVLIEGEAGIGKSRLMSEYRANSDLENALFWSGTCTPQHAHYPFALFAQMLGEVFGIQARDDAETVRERIDRALEQWPADTRFSQPYLEVLAGVRPSGSAGERLLALEPDQLRQQTFVALRRLVRTLTRAQPLLLFLDDLHWIDPVSADLLVFLASIVATDPVLFVCAQRREGGDAPNNRLRQLEALLPDQTLHIALERLSDEDSDLLIGDLLPGATLPASVREHIVGRSEGNPYFLEEYVRVLIDADLVRRTPSGWRTGEQVGREQLPLPSSLQALLRTRIDTLPPELRAAIHYGAILGDNFEADLLQELLTAPDTPERLERLASRLILTHDETRDVWRFRHRLFQSVVYDSLLERQRRRLHAQVAQALERKPSSAATDHAVKLAFHYQRAGRVQEARHYLTLAGEQALANFAIDGALKHFEQAAQLIAHDPPPQDEMRWRIGIGLGDASYFTSRYDEAAASFMRLIPMARAGGLSQKQIAELLRRLGETAQKQGEYDRALRFFDATRATLGKATEPAIQRERARALLGIAWVYFGQGNLDAAQNAAEKSLQLADDIEALNEKANAENLLGGIHYRRGQWRAALDRTTRAMMVREQMGYSWGVAKTLGNMGILTFTAGEWGKAVDFFERSLQQRQENGDIEGVAIVLNNLGIVRREQGDFPQAARHFRDSVEAAMTCNSVYHAANAGVGICSVQLLLENVGAARQAWNDAWQRADAIRAQDILVELTRLKSEIHLADGETSSAVAAAVESAERSAAMGNRSFEAAGWRVASEAYRHLGQLEAARAAIARSRSALADGPDELEQARIALQEGRVMADSGDREAALTAFAWAREIVTRLGAHRYASELHDT